MVLVNIRFRLDISMLVMVTNLSIGFGAWQKLRKKGEAELKQRNAEAECIATGSCCTQLLWMKKLLHDYGIPQETMCHAPNPIPGFVTMTSMLISSLNLILTRTNLTFWKLLQKLSSFFIFLFLYLNDITFHLTFRASTLYSKNNIIHQLFKFHPFT